MSKPTLFPLLPRDGSRLQKVLRVLHKQSAPMSEAELLAAHGLGGVPPTKWRQGPYKSGESTGLMERLDGRNWALTATGREMMDQAIADAGKRAAPPSDPGPTVPSRTATEWRPLVLPSWRETVRAGALDYRSIPSHFTPNT